MALGDDPIVSSPAELLSLLREGEVRQALLQASPAEDPWADYASRPEPVPFDGAELSALVGSSLLRRLHGLRVWATAEDLASLLVSSHLSGLTSLELRQCVRPNAVAALLDNRALRLLERLVLHDGWLGPAQLQRLVGGSFERLRELDIIGLKLGPVGRAGIEAFIGADRLKRLTLVNCWETRDGELSRALRTRFGDGVVFRG